MPAPPNSAQKAANQAAMDAAKTGNTSKGATGAGSKAGGIGGGKPGGAKSSGAAPGAKSPSSGYSGPKGTPAGGLNAAAKNAAAAAGARSAGYSGPKGTPAGGLNPAARGAAGKAGSILSNPSKVSQSIGAGPPRSPRFADPGVAGVPGGLLGRNQQILGGRLIGVVGGAAARSKKGQPFAGMTTRTLSQTIALADHLRSLGYGPLNITSAYRSQDVQNALRAANPAAARAGRIAKNSDHTRGTAIDISVPGMTNADLARAAAAFGGFSKVMGYGKPSNPQGSHIHASVGAGPTRGLGSIGGQRVSSLISGGVAPAAAPSPSLAAAPQADPRARALPQPKPANPGSAVLDSRLAAAKAGMPQVRASPVPAPREQVNGYLGGMPSLTPARPTVASTGFPAEDAPPSVFPGRPETPGSFPAATRPQSTFPARPAYPGSFPAEDARPSTFPARPAGVPGQKPARAPVSTFPGRPTFPGSFPAEDRQPSTFPARPEVPGSFPAARPQSTFPARPTFPGAFPAAKPPRNPASGMSFNPDLPGKMPGPERSRSPFVDGPEDGLLSAMPEDDPMDPVGDYDNPPRSFVGIPPSGFPRKTPAPQGGGFFAGLGKTLKKVAESGPVKQAKKAAGMVVDNINNPLLGLVRPPGPDNPVLGGGEGRPLRGGDKGNLPTQWTGGESPSQVANMQQHVEEVLRGYFVNVPGQQYPQYTTGPVEGAA